MPVTTSNKLTPPLKWAGGKRWLLPHLSDYWQDTPHCRLVEPFCGGLAVSLGLAPEQALINDVNPHLINFYSQIRKGLEVQIRAENDSNVFYANRERFNELIAQQQADTAEAAALFYYLNRTGFNGLCRFNNSGFFNVPFGRYKTIKYRENFAEYREQFSKWTFQCRDFTSLKIRPTDLIYADPPYDVEFTNYSTGGFTWQDQERLIEWLSTHPGPIILSNQATPRICELYQNAGYHLEFFDAPRRISCTGNRTPAREILAIRNL